MRTKILQDLIAAAMKAYPPPAWTDEAAVAVWAGALATSLVPVGYDLIKSDGLAPKSLSAGQEFVTQDEIEAAYNACCGGLGAPVGGKVLDWLKTVDWAKVLQTVLTIISLIPQAPA